MIIKLLAMKDAYLAREDGATWDVRGLVDEREGPFVVAWLQHPHVPPAGDLLQVAVVVAGDDGELAGVPLAPGADGFEHGLGEARGRVQQVSQDEHAIGARCLDERGARVELAGHHVRQRDAVGGEGLDLAQVQVREQQRASRVPERGALREQREVIACERDGAWGAHGEVLPGKRRQAEEWAKSVRRA